MPRLTRGDATRAARVATGVLAETMPVDDARRLVGFLESRGVRCVVEPTAALLLPQVRELFVIEAQRRALVIRDQYGHPRSLPCGAARRRAGQRRSPRGAPASEDDGRTPRERRGDFSPLGGRPPTDVVDPADSLVLVDDDVVQGYGTPFHYERELAWTRWRRTRADGVAPAKEAAPVTQET